jgi:hypothetical protein
LSGMVIDGGIPVAVCAVAKRGAASTAQTTRTARGLISGFIVSSPLFDDRIGRE